MSGRLAARKEGPSSVVHSVPFINPRGQQLQPTENRKILSPSYCSFILLFFD